MISKLTIGEYKLTFDRRVLLGGEGLKAQVSSETSVVRSNLEELSIRCCVVRGKAGNPHSWEGPKKKGLTTAGVRISEVTQNNSTAPECCIHGASL